MANAAPQAQTSLYEVEIEDAELERILEEREKAKAAKGAATKTFKEKDGAAKDRIEQLDIADGGVRVGRFIVKARAVEGGHRSFDVAPSSRLQISLLEND